MCDGSRGCSWSNRARGVLRRRTGGLKYPPRTMRTLAAIAGALTLLATTLVLAEAPGTAAANRVRLATKVHHLGEARHPHGRIVAHAAIIGGILAKDNTFPQLAFIVFKNGRTGFTCTGTVVAPRIVLTAGHCVEDKVTGRIFEPSGYMVVTGAVDWNTMPRGESRVSRDVVYPGFERTFLNADAALLILSTPTAAPAIRLASYASDSVRLRAGTTAVFAGWGSTRPGPVGSERLSWARTVVQSMSYCESNAGRFFQADEICTIDSPRNKTGLCFGDSGGPLLARSPDGSGDIEIGVASHIYSDCSSRRPSEFTRTDLIEPWVSKWIATVRHANPRSRHALAPG